MIEICTKLVSSEPERCAASCQLIALSDLAPHPDNANRMTPAMIDKLAAHIRESGEYPALIVRPLGDQFQILDGHHRAEALRRLGHTHARCEVWSADDERASVLLLTLNRLRGEDDPQRRGALFENLSRTLPISELTRIVPENAARIRRLIEAAQPPASLRKPAAFEQLPQAVTFFLSASQRRRLFDRLQNIHPDRSAALVHLLELGATTSSALRPPIAPAASAIQRAIDSLEDHEPDSHDEEQSRN